MTPFGYSPGGWRPEPEAREISQLVIPARPGSIRPWIPAFAGMTPNEMRQLEAGPSPRPSPRRRGEGGTRAKRGRVRGGHRASRTTGLRLAADADADALDGLRLRGVEQIGEDDRPAGLFGLGQPGVARRDTGLFIGQRARLDRAETAPRPDQRRVDAAEIVLVGGEDDLSVGQVNQTVRDIQKTRHQGGAAADLAG